MSQALPSWAYSDPARIVEGIELRTRGCEVCIRAVFIGGRAMCSSGLSLPACKRDRRNGYRLAADAGGEA